MTPRVGVRWTIGDVHACGFEALGWSIRGAAAVFGRDAAFAVCVNSIPAADARARVGRVPVDVDWVQADDLIPRFIRESLDAALAEGVGWKFAPLRLFPDRHEIALDNDCILWRMPASVNEWLETPDWSCLLAADVMPAFGRFARACGVRPINTGIRGLRPGFDLRDALERALGGVGGPLSSELDEQGLQAAALVSAGPLHVVSLDEVSICSPFAPHSPDLGRCGAHFVGLNARTLPWDYYGTPASELTRAHWRRLEPLVRARLQNDLPPGHP